MRSGVTGWDGNLDHGNLERDGAQAIRRNACAKDLDNSAVDGDVRSGLGMGGHMNGGSRVYAKRCPRLNWGDCEAAQIQT